MKKLFIIPLLFFLIPWSGLNGQCDQSLVEMAISQSGHDVQFIREFKVHLKGGTKKKPLPVAKYTTYLQEGNLYRFNVVNSDAFEGEAIFQLYRRNEKLGSTFNSDLGKDNRQFEYYCDNSGTFELIISFNAGKEGCAVGVLSLVLTDSVIRQKELAEMEIFYTGVENPVSVSFNETTPDSFQISISQGQIFKRDGDWYARVDEEGIATIQVVLFNDRGEVKDSASIDFLVQRLPFPYASLAGMRGGVISKFELTVIQKLEISSPVDFEKFGFKIERFIIYDRDKRYRTYPSSGNYFTATQKSFIAGLANGTRLLIDEISVITPWGEILEIDPIAFVIQ